MVFQKLGQVFPNYFIGGYITSLCMHEPPYEEKSFISIGMKVKTGKGNQTRTVLIMVFKLAGYEGSKYPNPMAKIVCDCYEQGRPLACCYYQKGKSNIMSCCFTNFSVTAPTNGRTTEALPSDNVPQSEFVQHQDDIQHKDDVQPLEEVPPGGEFAILDEDDYNVPF